jgi:hypothetical protein
MYRNMMRLRGITPRIGALNLFSLTVITVTDIWIVDRDLNAAEILHLLHKEITVSKGKRPIFLSKT